MVMDINGQSIDIGVSDLHLVEPLGKGINGQVNKMEHLPSGAVMAVKVRIFVIVFHFQIYAQYCGLVVVMPRT
jgi:hypothetical protein